MQQRCPNFWTLATLAKKSSFAELRVTWRFIKRNSLTSFFRYFFFFQALFWWVSLKSVLFLCFSNPLFRSILQTKIHLETAQTAKQISRTTCPVALPSGEFCLRPCCPVYQNTLHFPVKTLKLKTLKETTDSTHTHIQDFIKIWTSLKGKKAFKMYNFLGVLCTLPNFPLIDSLWRMA